MAPNLQTVDTACGLDRRTFCQGALAAGLGLAACRCGGGGGSSTPSSQQPPPASGAVTTTDTKAGLLADAAGTTHDYRNLGGFLLIRDSGGIYAMTTVCTHMGCTVDLPVGTVITCPCHGSQYDLGGGNLQGPATMPLVHYAVTEPTPGADLVVHKDQVVSASTRLT
jgi:Rieske Fe-S protein